MVVLSHEHYVVGMIENTGSVALKGVQELHLVIAVVEVELLRSKSL